MSALDDVVEAIRAADDDGWAIADRIANIPRRGETGYVTNEGIAKYIAGKLPIEVSAGYVSKMRQTADAFPAGTRVPAVSFSAHRIMRGDPKRLIEWAKKHPGKPLTVTEADKLRPKSSITPPKPDAWQEKVDRALGVIDNLAENDPAWTIDVLYQALATLENRYPKARRHGMRAV